MPFVQRHPMLAALAVVASLLAGVIALELALGSTTARIPAASNRAAPAESKLLPPIVATAAEQAYPETAARPLFTPTRRPAPEAPAQQGAMVKGQFILQGVTIHGEIRIALLREKASGRTHRVERGKDVNGMTLASVDTDRVVLALGADREELVLTVQKAPLPPPPQTAAALAGPPPPPLAPLPNTIATPVGQPVSGAGPFLPSGFAPAPSTPAAAPAAPAQPAAGAQSSLAPLTPEEVLARRRARRVPGAPQ